MNYDIAKEMKIQGLKGVDFKYAKFKPKNLPGRSENPKFEGYFCAGQKLVITDKNKFRSVDTAIHSVIITIMFYMDNFRYDSKKIDYLWGNKIMNKFLRGDLKPKIFFKLLKQHQEKFIIQSAPYYLYQ
jgi:uncharacterized protein YbbC (DUF1343 family)